MMSGREVAEWIQKIGQMSAQEIEEMQKKLSLSSVDAKARGFLYRACDERISTLSVKYSAMAIPGELDDAREWA